MKRTMHYNWSYWVHSFFGLGEFCLGIKLLVTHSGGAFIYGRYHGSSAIVGGYLFSIYGFVLLLIPFWLKDKRSQMKTLLDFVFIFAISIFIEVCSFTLTR